MRNSYSHNICVIGWSLLWIILAGSANVWAQTPPDSIWSFSKVRMDADGDQELDYYGEKVTVTGIANINSGLLHEYYLQAFIQNDSAGLSIFAMNIETPFKVGDSLVVHGNIEQYNGLTEIHIDRYQVFEGVADEPTPEHLSHAIKDPVKYLGMLIQGKGRIIDKGSTFNGKYLRIKPANTDSSMMVYVSNFHRLFDEFHFGVLSVGDEIRVKGIVSESNPDFPNERIFKIFLRSPEDLQYSGIPKFFLYMIIGGAVLIGLVIAIWIFMLRKKVTSKTTEIRSSLQEKEVLLREIHHRVKNSLSIVSALIELQLHETDSPEAKDVLQNSKSRIQSVALIHDKLYRTESLARVELDVYIRDLVETIHSTFTEYSEAVELVFDMDSLELDTDRVIPCGLLINELVVNAYKHAFKKDRQGKLFIKIKDQGDSVFLEVSDNGPGLSDNANQDNSEGLGSLLVNSFKEKLNATMDVTEDDSGTTFTFIFPKQKKTKKQT